MSRLEMGSHYPEASSTPLGAPTAAPAEHMGLRYGVRQNVRDLQ